MTVETVKEICSIEQEWFAALRRLRRKQMWGTSIVILVALLSVPYVSNNLALKLTLWISFGLCALSLSLVWGRAGIFSFGQNALFGLGAYAYAVVSLNAYPTTQETVTALLASGMFGAIAAAALGYFLFYSRLSDVYLSIVTLAVTLIIYTVLASTAGPEYHIGEAPLGGFNGIPSLPGIAFPEWMGVGNGELSIRQLLAFSIVFAGAIYVSLCMLARSSFGLRIEGLRSNELRMELLGYDVRRLKIVVFCIGGAVAGFGGGLFAAWGTFVNPSVFSLAQAATVVVWAMVGGRESLVGAFVGVLVVQSVADGADLLIQQQTPLIVGLILVFVVIAMPQGIVPSLQRILRLAAVGDSLGTAGFEFDCALRPPPIRNGVGQRNCQVVRRREGARRSFCVFRRVSGARNHWTERGRQEHFLQYPYRTAQTRSRLRRDQRKGRKRSAAAHALPSRARHQDAGSVHIPRPEGRPESRAGSHGLPRAHGGRRSAEPSWSA